MSRFGRRPIRTREPVPEFEAGLADSPGADWPCTLSDVEKDLSRVGASCSVAVACHTVLNWGNRHDNEDRIVAAHACHGDLKYHVIGVLDGHDTEAASDAVSKVLPSVLGKHLKTGMGVEQGFRDTMAECEEALKKTVASAGTCVCSCLVAGRFVWCSNLGDCRAVLISLELPPSTSGPTKATAVHWLSRDQKANSPDEMRRIRAAGGRVVNGRVEGLEPSRTLGDFDVKMQTPEGVISIIPEVRCHELGRHGELPAQGLLICATDGVWDVMTGQDICDIIHSRTELAAVQIAVQAEEVQHAAGRVDTQPLRDIAEDLVQFAVARGSHDDCTAVAALISVA